MHFNVLVVVPVVLGLVGCGFIAFALWTRRQAAASQTWPSTPGRIVTSVLDTSRDEERTTFYAAKIEYTYRVGEEEHRGSRVRFGLFGRSNNATEARGIIARYPVGAAVEVFYDPATPSRCILERRGAGSFLLVFGGLFVVVAIIVPVMLSFIVSERNAMLEGIQPKPSANAERGPASGR